MSDDEMQHDAQGEPAAQDEAELARLLARHNRDLRELLGHRDAVNEAEKRALARELHDNLGSSLTAFNMHLSLLQHELAAEVNLQKRLEQMKTLLLSITDSTRRLQGSLRPEKLDVFGLKVALTEYALEFARRTGVACRTSLPDDELDFPESYKIALFRIVEEALANVQRHAQASEVDVILDDSEDGVLLTVRDNGAGIAHDAQDDLATHGLRAMRERAGYLGGTLRVGPGRNGAGTAISVELPPHGGAGELA
jgi:signal transduction histidine kinase